MAHRSQNQSDTHTVSATIRPNGWTIGVVLCSLAAMLTGVERVHADNSPVPQFTEWESNMVSYGRQHCSELAPGGAPESYQAEYTYYDAEAVYYQIMKHTGDPTWKYCAGLAQNIYRDKLVLPQNGRVQGYWAFTKGLLLDWQRTKDPLDYTAVDLIVHNAAFAGETPLEWTASIDSSREVAYAIMNYLNAEAMGQPRRQRLADMVNQALGHVDKWFVSKTAPYMRPFMVAITCKALIQYYEVTQDPRVPPAVKKAIDGTWAQTWLAQHQTFQYTNNDTKTISSTSMGYNTGGTDPAPDLNLIIAPVYAWWYMQSGDTTYRDKADQIFAGGVTKGGPSLYYAKQFNQNYWWSFEYLRYRQLAQPAGKTGSSVDTTSTNSVTTPSPAPSNSGTPSPPTTAPSTATPSQSLTKSLTTTPAAPPTPSPSTTPTASPTTKESPSASTAPAISLTAPAAASSMTSTSSTSPAPAPAPRILPAAAATPSQSLTAAPGTSAPATAAPLSSGQQASPGQANKPTLTERFVGKLKKFMELVK
jgi:hypothetical protein